MRVITRYTATERLLRNHLEAEGWEKDSVRIVELDLRAIERPGWVQFFVFELRATRIDAEDDAMPSTLLGVLRDDGRGRMAIRLCDARENREAVLEDWSGSVARPARVTPEELARTSERLFLVLMVIFAGALVAAACRWCLASAPADHGSHNIDRIDSRRQV